MTINVSEYDANASADAFLSGDLATVTAAYRAVHATQRATAARAFMRAVAEKGGDVIAAMAATESAEKATMTASRKSVVIDADVAEKVRSDVSAMIASSIQTWIDDHDADQFGGMLSDPSDTLSAEFIGRCRDAAIAAVRNVATGSKVHAYDPNGNKWTLSSMVAFGVLSVGQSLTMTYAEKNTVGVIELADDGKARLVVKSGRGKGSYASVSAAATAVIGTTSSGKKASVDGRIMWRTDDDRSVADLVNAS